MSSDITVGDSTESPNEVDERLQDMFVMDWDFHLMIRHHHVLPYVDDPVTKEKFEDNIPPHNKASPFHAQFQSDFDSLGNTHGEAETKEDIQEAMESMALDVAVVTPTGFRANHQEYQPMHTELFKAENDYILDKVVDPDNGIYAALALPQWNPEAAAEEIRRVGDEEGIVGAQAWYGQFKMLGGDPAFDVVFEELEKRGFPLLIHGSDVGHSFEHSRRTYTESLVNDWPYFASVMATNMIFNGVFEKFPDLNVVLQEAGTQWISNVAHRGDEIYQVYPEEVKLSERMRELDLEYLPKMPSEYLREHFYAATQPVAPPPANQVEGWLENNYADEMFLFASDYPHASIDIANWVFDNPIDDDTREQILSGNARDLIDV